MIVVCLLLQHLSVHLYILSVRINTSQNDVPVLNLQRDCNHSFVDLFSLHDLPLPSLVQHYSGSVLLVEAIGAHEDVSERRFPHLTVRCSNKGALAKPSHTNLKSPLGLGLGSAFASALATGPQLAPSPAVPVATVWGGGGNVSNTELINEPRPHWLCPGFAWLCTWSTLMFLPPLHAISCLCQKLVL